MDKFKLFLFRVLMAICGVITLVALVQLPSTFSRNPLSAIGGVCIFAALTGWLHQKTQEITGESANLDMTLTPERFVELYHEELDNIVKVATKPEEDSFRVQKNVDYTAFKIVDTVKYDDNRGYFQLGEKSFKIHWIRRGSPSLKGIALEMVNPPEVTIQYGSDEDEKLLPIVCIVPSVINALYRPTIVDRGDVAKLWKEIVEYTVSALESNVNDIESEFERTQQPLIKKERSERFNFDEATIVVNTMAAGNSHNGNAIAYMTVAKNAEFENLLSYENVHQH